MEHIEKQVSEIKNLIGNADLDSAIGHILDFAWNDSANLNLIYELKYRYSDLKKELIEGVIRYPDLKIEKNKLAKDLLSLIEVLKEERAKKLKTNEEKKQPILEQKKDIPVIFIGEGISKSFEKKGSKAFRLEPMNITLREGEITGVIGINGSGKTTLLRIIAGVKKASKKTILNFLFDENNNRFKLSNFLYEKYFRWYNIKSCISFIPEDFSSRAEKVFDTLVFEGAKNNFTVQKKLKLAEFFLQRLGLEEFRNNKCAELSKGFQLRLELAIALMKQPRILVLDEPFAHLDVKAKERFTLDLKNITKSAKPTMTTILSSHQIFEIEYVADKIIFLEDGTMTYYGKSMSRFLDIDDNYFEFYTHAKVEIESIIKKNPVKIIRLGLTYLAITPNEINIHGFIEILKKEQLTPIYLRDISHSLKARILSKNENFE